jgi:GNAT superfamily N-acetyltransferase
MSAVEIRPFRRSDRDQLTALVNAHVGAVLPGVTLSVNATLSQLEREPDEYVVDPWVVERATFVAVAEQRIVAAAHLVRYGDDASVGPDHRGAAELRWLICWSSLAVGTGDRLAQAALAQAAAWGATRVHADGALPAPGVYGVPDCWPHVRGIYARAGFRPHAEELLFAADVQRLPRPGDAPLPGLTITRCVGDAAVVFAADGPQGRVGLIELEPDLTLGGVYASLAGWAELWNLEVAEPWRRRGVGRFLVAHAAEWLRFAGARRLLDACGAEEHDHAAFLRACGWRQLARIERGWTRERP